MKHFLRSSEITDDVSESGLGAGVIYEHVKQQWIPAKCAYQR